jgi:hypothetical protein
VLFYFTILNSTLLFVWSCLAEHLTQLTYKGFGDTQLLNQCRKGVKCSEEEHAINRRSEFIVTEI